MQRGLEVAPPRGQIDRRQMRGGPSIDRPLTLEHPSLQLRREALGRVADLAAEQRHHRLREGDVTARIEHIVAAQPVRDHAERHVSNRGGRRRDLHEVAEQQVDLGVPLADLVPAVLEPDAPSLLAEVRVLRAGHLVPVDVRRAGAHVGLERRVVAAHGFPVA